MKRKAGASSKGTNRKSVLKDDSDSDVGDIFTDEINDFTNERNHVERDLIDKPSDSEDEEELFGLVDQNDGAESDDEIGEWSKRLKQIKFQARLDKNKPVGDAPERSWGNKRADFYGSGVRRKPKKAESDGDDEWAMEEKEIEKLQKKLDEDLDEDDFLIPSMPKKEMQKKQKAELSIKRNLDDKEQSELRSKLHPEAAPLREELNRCLEELESLKDLSGWKIESRDTCFRMLAANIAFYLHLVESDENCKGHPVLKRIVQWKKLSKLYEAVPLELMAESDVEEEDNEEEATNRDVESHPVKKPRLTLEDSEEEDLSDPEAGAGEDGEMESRPVTYEIEKNKPEKKTAPNNPRVKHREKFRKAKIRRRGQIRENKREIFKYQGEASGIRAGLIKSMKFKH